MTSVLSRFSDASTTSRMCLGRLSMPACLRVLGSSLTAHACINMRLPTYGGIYAWEFEKRERALKVRVEGQLVFNNIALRVNAALSGLGLAYLSEDQVHGHVAEGRLVRVLGDWCPPFSG